MILVDTSVWIDHLRSRVPLLQAVLDEGAALTHPIVIGELACGNLRDRCAVLDLLQRLGRAPVADDHEAVGYIERHRLMGRGIGYADVQLLASATLAGVRVWTRDKRFLMVAKEMKVSYSEYV